MADDDAIKRLEARLTRLEAALAQQPGGVGGGGTTGVPPGGVVTDPAPWPTGPWGHVRWPWHWPIPHTVVDPGPWPSPVVDPAPSPWGTVGGPGGLTQASSLASTFGRIGQIGDPPPIDVSRFSISQLEGALHSINSEKARLNSLETLLKQQLEKVKAKG
jgi:hypothetical protein